MKRLLYAIRRRLPRSFRTQLYRAGLFFGDEFIDRSGHFGGNGLPSIAGTLRYLQEWGFCPNTAVDVGAFKGDWTRLVKSIFPSLQVLMIEPQLHLRPALDDLCVRYDGLRCESAVIGATDGTTVPFAEMNNGSSVFEEASPVPRVIVQKSTSTLASTINRTCGWQKVDLLKIDVQGYELEVLKGAASYLPTCEVVLVEASVIPVNKGCPLIDEVFAFMEAAGFRLLDFCSQIRRKDHALWQTDLLFINKRSHLTPVSELNASNW